MNIITTDFETYWASDYTLSRMSPLAYVMGDRYETQSCAIKVNDEKTGIYFGHNAIAARLDELDIPNSALLAHNNSGFDSYISSYRFKLKPKMWLCTVAMARAQHAKTIGVSLAKLVRHYGLGEKNAAVLHQTKGRYLSEFTADEIERMRIYNGEDSDQCYALFKLLRQEFSMHELWQIDAVIRMRTEPKLCVDREMLSGALVVERASKRTALMELAHMLRLARSGTAKETNWANDDEAAEYVRSELASAPKFAAMLLARGVECPMKLSPSDPDSGKMVPALAKSDREFIALQEHDDELVACAARTRLAVKSTLLETRIEKLLEANEMAGGLLPVPIRYCGADTTWRDSGEEYNMLNLPRVSKSKPKVSDALRNGIRAPKGKLIIVADQSNIELRVNHTLWQVPYSTTMWAANPDADLYRAGAVKAHGCTEAEVTFDMRQLEKVKQLGLGFGAGADTFRVVAKTQFGVDLARIMRHVTQDEIDAAGPGYEFEADKDGWAVVCERDPALEAVTTWRADHSEITAGWKVCNLALQWIEAGDEMALDALGLVSTCKDGLRLHTGRNHIIRYPDLREELNKKTKRREWVYASGRHRARIYGPKADENIVQALARDTVMDCTVAFFKETGLRPALRPYDELVYVVEAAAATELLAVLQTIMRTPPKWWPSLNVWSEGGIAATYGSAK